MSRLCANVAGLAGARGSNRMQMPSFWPLVGSYTQTVTSAAEAS